MAYSKVCMIRRCPQQSVARIDDGSHRADLCPRHLRSAALLYGNLVKVTATYGEFDPELVRILEMSGVETMEASK